jgi:hypothetical protein
MSDRLVVHKGGESQLEYDRSKPLPDHQQQYLDRMDMEMDQGINLGDEFVPHPDFQKKALYVAQILAKAVTEDNEAAAAAACSWLATRLPDLKQVKITNVDERQGIDLIFDKEFVPETPINFVPPENFDKQ